MQGAGAGPDRVAVLLQVRQDVAVRPLQVLQDGSQGTQLDTSGLPT